MHTHLLLFFIRFKYQLLQRGMEMEGVVFVSVLILGCAGIIFAAEVYDRKEDARHRRILRDSIRRTGVVKSVERKGMLEGRDAYQWRMTVEFEYGGERYSIEEQCLQRPMCSQGDRITVYVDREDPWRSRIQI